MNKIDRLELGWLAARPVVRLKIIDRERERERGMQGQRRTNITSLKRIRGSIYVEFFYVA